MSRPEFERRRAYHSIYEGYEPHKYNEQTLSHPISTLKRDVNDHWSYGFTWDRRPDHITMGLDKHDPMMGDDVTARQLCEPPAGAPLGASLGIPARPDVRLQWSSGDCTLAAALALLCHGLRRGCSQQLNAIAGWTAHLGVVSFADHLVHHLTVRSVQFVALCNAPPH